METPQLKDKVALITGASKGFGKAIAFSLAKSGATVIILLMHTGRLLHREL